MLRVVAARVASTARTMIIPRTSAVNSQAIRNSSHGPKETDEEFDERYVNFFNRKDIDHWEIRKAMNDLAGESRACLSKMSGIFLKYINNVFVKYKKYIFNHIHMKLTEDTYF